MSLATAELPTDLEALRAFAAQLQAEIYAKTLHIEKLKAELALLKQGRYGRSSERIDQMELLIGELGEDAAEQGASSARARTPSHRRSPTAGIIAARPPASAGTSAARADRT